MVKKLEWIEMAQLAGFLDSLQIAFAKAPTSFFNWT
jgi:hypothetical protein